MKELVTDDRQDGFWLDLNCLMSPWGQRNLKVTAFRRNLKPQVESDVVSEFVNNGRIYLSFLAPYGPSRISPSEHEPKPLVFNLAAFSGP